MAFPLTVSLTLLISGATTTCSTGTTTTVLIFGGTGFTVSVLYAPFTGSDAALMFLDLSNALNRNHLTFCVYCALYVLVPNGMLSFTIVHGSPPVSDVSKIYPAISASVFGAHVMVYSNTGVGTAYARIAALSTAIANKIL